MEFAIPRTPVGGLPYPSVRFRDGGSWGSWSKIYAGYADSAGTSTSASSTDYWLNTTYGTNEIKAGTGDGASYTTYNVAFRSWYGIGFRDNTDSATVNAYLDCRTGTFSTKGQLISTVATGTAPLTVSSTTLVSNLNASYLQGYQTATAANGNTIVLRDANGDDYRRYGFGSYFNSTDDVSAGTLTYLMGKFGDNYYRSATAAKVAAFLSGQTLNVSSTSATTATTATYLNTAYSSSTADDIRNRLNSGFWQSSTATTGEGWPTTTNDWYHLISSTHSNEANYYALQLAAPFFSQNLYYRSTNGSGTTAWTEVVTSEKITLNNSASPINPDSVTQNQLGYCTNVSLFSQGDGGLYSSAYSSSWIHQIFGDFRTGQIAIRGKNNGTWGAWRTVIDSSNIGSYGTNVGDLTGGNITGDYQVTQAIGIRFGATNQTDINDGFISAGRFASGLNIVGTQTTAGTGRQVRVWGSLIDSGGTSYVLNSGTWNINITGNAATATSTGSATYATYVSSPDGDRDAGTKLPTTSPLAVRFDFANASTTGTGGNYAGVMTYAPWTGTTASTGDASYQLAFGSTLANGGGIPQLNIRKGIDSTWNSWYTIIHSGNIGSYAASNVSVVQTGYNCTAPITTSSGTITIGTSSNAYGRKFVSPTEPTSVCDGDIWFDTSVVSGSSVLSAVGAANQILYKNASNIATGSGNLTFDGNDLLMDGNFILNSGPKFTTQGFNFQLKDGILTPTNKTKFIYDYTGTNRSFGVPVGVNWIFVKLWGAGGGAGRSGGWIWGAEGGGGGHVKGLFPVTPGSTIILVVGRGGTTVNGLTQSYGGGGTNGSDADNSYGGHGGGYCGVFVNSVSQANALAIAGGGGGGGSSRIYNGNIGGAGGGLIGQRGGSPYDGKFTSAGNPGRQNGGGLGGVGGGGHGGILQGGPGAAESYGGGGGAGYFGGGGGGYSESNTMGGGGGGSGFVKSTGLLLGTYAGNYRMVAYPMDPDLLTPTVGQVDIELPGYGGQNTQNNQGAGAQSGGHAYAVIYY